MFMFESPSLRRASRTIPDSKQTRSTNLKDSWTLFNFLASALKLPFHVPDRQKFVTQLAFDKQMYVCVGGFRYYSGN